MMFPRASQGLFAGFEAAEQLHPSDPHWYLAFVGSDPVVQSRGIGRALLAPVLAIADETNRLCYLETRFPRTHAFYASLGFVRRAELSVFTGTPGEVVTFLREPGPVTQDRSSRFGTAT